MLYSYYKSFSIILLLIVLNNGYGSPIIPMTPQNSIGGDSVRGRDGTTCNQGTHIGPTLDFGIAGIKNTNASNSSDPQVINNYYSNQESSNNIAGNELGVYARIIIPIGEEPARIDCTQLYALEIERLKMELENMKKAGSSAVSIE
jgi:hypothetical protein